jgi:hypothetical protein
MSSSVERTLGVSTEGVPYEKNSSEETTIKLQEACIRINDWTRLWRIAYRKNVQIPVAINNSNIPFSNTAKYLAMNLGIRLRWKEHKKRKGGSSTSNIKIMYWLLGRKSQLSVHNKLLLYKQVLKPIWTCGIQLWGCAATSNIDETQIFPNKAL